MYTIYDLELSREIIATLSYIALTCGIKLKNKNQFNYIIYKLYNYLKNDFTFENGIVINEAIKEKINNFKTIHSELYYPVVSDSIEEYYCTFPKYAQNSATAPFLDDEYTTLDDIDSAENREYKIPYKFWCDPKNSSDYCSVQIEVKHKTTGAITKLISYTSKQILANLDYWEIYLSTNATKTAFTFTRKSFSTDGNLIKSETLTYSTVYNPTLYDVRVYKVYGDYYPTECYSTPIFPTFDETDLAETDSSNLVIGDKYYAKDFYQPTSYTEIILDCILQKHLNGEFIGFKYGNLNVNIGQICQYDKNELKFITITSNEERTSYTGYVSTYPLYVTNVSGEVGLWFFNTGEAIPVKIFKSENGEIWKEITTLSDFIYKTDAFEVKTKALSFVGEDIIYSNYPVYYSLIGSNFEDRQLQVLNEAETYNEEGIPYALEEDNTFKLYRNSDEDFTLDRMPLGASFYFGKHKIEDSPKFKLIFRPLDYTSNINTKYGNKWLPYDAVYCDSVNIIDMLSFHNYIDYNKTDIIFGNSHLPRWLNSDAPTGEWWTQINDLDTPSVEENMYNSTDSKGYEFGHRAGFLHHFEDVEKELLIDLEIANYEGKKVLLYDINELPSLLNYNYRPKLFSANGGYIKGVLEPYCVNELKYHKNSTVSEKTQVPLNDFVSNYKYTSHWTRSKANNYGQYYNPSSYGNNAYYGCGIKPVICLPKGVKVRREPDEYGVFSLDLPIVETVDFIVKFETEINIQENFEEVKETEIKVTNTFENVFNTIINTGVSLKNLFETFRNIRNTANEIYNTARCNTQKFEKVFETSRMHNFVFQPKYNVERRVASNFEKVYSTERNTNEEYLFNVKFDIERRVAKDFFERFNTKLEVLGVFEKTYQNRRFIRENFEIDYDTVLDVIVHREFIYPLLREVLEDFENIYDTRIRVANNFSNIFESEREVYAKEVLVYNTERRVLKNLEEEIEGFTRFIRSKETAKYPTFRYMAEPTVERFDIERRVTETHKPNYPTERKVIRHLQALERYSTYRYVKANSENYYSVLRKTIANIVFDEFALLRSVVQNIDFIEQCERYVLENITTDYEACRNIVEDFEKINEAVIYVLNNSEDIYESNISIANLFNIENMTLREVIENMEVNYPTKRATTVTVNKYVSKDNLMLYTVLLKQEIATFIEQKINYELEKRGL